MYSYSDVKRKMWRGNGSGGDRSLSPIISTAQHSTAYTKALKATSKQSVTCTRSKTRVLNNIANYWILNTVYILLRSINNNATIYEWMTADVRSIPRSIAVTTTVAMNAINQQQTQQDIRNYYCLPWSTAVVNYSCGEESCARWWMVVSSQHLLFFYVLRVLDGDFLARMVRVVRGKN